uniref:Uncharacterized protein n=1 Tax=Glossina austeni TaxID=7395 RepID=A0A1A9UFG2_GLOAU
MTAALTTITIAPTMQGLCLYLIFPMFCAKHRLRSLMGKLMPYLATPTLKIDIVRINLKKKFLFQGQELAKVEQWTSKNQCLIFLFLLIVGESTVLVEPACCYPPGTSNIIELCLLNHSKCSRTGLERVFNKARDVEGIRKPTIQQQTHCHSPINTEL